MSIETLANTRLGRICIRVLASIMESRLRYRLLGPARILQGADIGPGQNVLEVGCGTGFFTVPLARLLGEQGSVVAMDVLAPSVEAVTRRVQSANLENVTVVQGNALDTQLPGESFDAVIVFGVIPAPMLPMGRFLAEMKRVLKPGGTMAVWPTTWVHRTIVASGLFTYAGKRKGVSNYKRIEPSLTG